MKTYLLNAARKQRMVENTVVTTLADEALNYWSVILSLFPHCQEVSECPGDCGRSLQRHLGAGQMGFMALRRR